MANGKDGQFEPEWCKLFRDTITEKLEKKDMEVRALWNEINDLDDKHDERVKEIDNKYDKKFTSILFLLITNLLTLLGAFALLFFKGDLGGL